MRVPIACTLTVDEAPARLEEWRAAFATVVASVVRVEPTRLDLRVSAPARDLGSLIDLVQHEAACCAFFDFALHIDSDAITLRVTVPPDAAAILDDFATLAQPAG